MNAHIINCDEEEFFNSFRPNGYLGVGLVIKSIAPQALSRACRTSYSMCADMKTIRVGDIIFVHAAQKIYGAFKAATEFCENPRTPQRFLSTNIHYNPNPNKPNSGWRGNITEPADIGYYRRIAITHFTDKQGRNLCFEKGIDSNEVFELKLKKSIWSVPERWLYGDTKRTVRPLMENEAFDLLKILDRENADNSRRLAVKPAKLANYKPIRFVLDPNIVVDEKIIEGWVLENIGRHPDLDSALGPLTSFGNNMPAGYLKFMDIFGYQQLSLGIRKYKVIEIKKDECSFPNDVNQVIGYADWVVENIAEGDYKLVESIIIAKDFDDGCINFANNFNSMARKMRLIKFNYDPPTFNRLNITKVV